jgi:hypothetical protein
VAILLTYGTARVLLASDAEAREEEHRRATPTRGLKFRALLSEGDV